MTNPKMKTILLSSLTILLASLLTIVGIQGILRAIMEENKKNFGETPIIEIVPVNFRGINRSHEEIGSYASQEILNDLIKALSSKIAVSYNVVEPVKLPAITIDKERDQVNAQSALNGLSLAHKNTKAFRVVFLTSEDLFVPGLNFVFGIAQPGGRFCIASDARLYPKPKVTPLNEREKYLYIRRLSKVILHELGHTWMLPHSNDNRSLMKFHNSVLELDKTGDELLAEDRKMIIKRFPFLEPYIK